jgi:DNA polymerase I
MLETFREVVTVDTEFTVIGGDHPIPICVVAHELRSGRRFRIFEGEFGPSPPYATGPDVLFVAFVAQAELGIYRVLDWLMPERILDLYAEFRCRTNMGSGEDQAERTPAGRGLLGALIHFGFDGGGATEKKELQQALADGSWRGRFSKEEVLDYCERDVTALDRLLPAMLPGIDLERALLRGRYTVAVSAMEHTGVPIDRELLTRLRTNWEPNKQRLVQEIDAEYGVYEHITFKQDRFSAWLAREGIPWPRLVFRH